MISIYKIISPSNKIYIGQSVRIERRFNDYEILDCKSQIRLYNSLKYHGVNKHKFEVVEECEILQLNIRERYWQDYYEVIGRKGLNCRLTAIDDKKGLLSENTKRKIGTANKGRKTRLGMKNTEESKRKASISHKGKKLSNQHKEKLSLNNARSKRVIDTITNEIYPSLKKACEVTNLKYVNIKSYMNKKNMYQRFKYLQ